VLIVSGSKCQTASAIIGWTSPDTDWLPNLPNLFLIENVGRMMAVYASSDQRTLPELVCTISSIQCKKD